jgi:hypothetical protein
MSVERRSANYADVVAVEDVPVNERAIWRVRIPNKLPAIDNDRSSHFSRSDFLGIFKSGTSGEFLSASGKYGALQNDLIFYDGRAASANVCNEKFRAEWFVSAGDDCLYMANNKSLPELQNQVFVSGLGGVDSRPSSLAREVDSREKSSEGFGPISLCRVEFESEWPEALPEQTRIPACSASGIEGLRPQDFSWAEPEPEMALELFGIAFRS